jgi:hypothetical protein
VAQARAWQTADRPRRRLVRLLAIGTALQAHGCGLTGSKPGASTSLCSPGSTDTGHVRNRRRRDHTAELDETVARRRPLPDLPSTTKRPKELVGGPANRFVSAPNKSGVDTLRPGPSFGGLAAIEPGSRDRPEDRSPVRSGGSHLPLRAGRNVLGAAMTPQPPYPRTSLETAPAYPPLSNRCGWHVDDPFCNICATRARRRFQ